MRPSDKVKFQFQTGSIKSNMRTPDELTERVSIPNWFD